jgi:hypothetical protein
MQKELRELEEEEELLKLRRELQRRTELLDHVTMYGAPLQLLKGADH